MIAKSMRNTTIELDDFAIWVDDVRFLDHHLLNELYGKHGFFKRLHIYCRQFYQEDADRLSSLNGVFVKFSADWANHRMNLTAFSNLEEIRVWKSESLDAVAGKLTNLKRIHFVKAFRNDLLPFISHAEGLTKIKVDLFLDDTSANENRNTIDLSTLNKKRQELAKGRDLKVTIYVEEDIYLATKWAMNGTECGLIRLKRVE